MVAGTRDGVLMVESEANQLDEKIMLGAVRFGFKEFQCVIDKIIELAEIAAKDSWQIPEKSKPDYLKKLQDMTNKELSSYKIKEKKKRNESLNRKKGNKSLNHLNQTQIRNQHSKIR